MGNYNETPADETASNDNYVSTYSQLINMGFPEELSFAAANTFSNDINKAINFIQQNNVSEEVEKAKQEMQLSSKIQTCRPVSQNQSPNTKTTQNSVAQPISLNNTSNKLLNETDIVLESVASLNKTEKESDGNSISNGEIVKEYRKRIEIIYNEKNPEKLDKIDKWLKKYKNNPHALYTKVCQTYNIDITPQSEIISCANNKNDANNDRREKKSDMNEVITIEQVDEKLNDVNCQSIAKCEALKRIIDVLKFYQKNNVPNDELLQCIMNCKSHLLNDYHHILNNHLNEDNITSLTSNQQFKSIYNQIFDENKLCCDVTQCQIYTRNNREREKDAVHDDGNLNVYLDILDSIHCYFVHSIDIGYRIINNLKDVSDDDSTHNNMTYDPEFSRLKSQLSFTREKLQKIRGDRLSNNKFMTEVYMNESETLNKEAINNEDNETKTDVPDKPKKKKKAKKRKKDVHYKFGQRYDYWSAAARGKKYNSIKEEVTQNKIYRISMDRFDSAYNKAVYLTNNSETIKNMKSVNKYEIKANLSLNINNILSIILYTDYDTLSFNFSKTFRKLKNESSGSVKKRNKEFFNWSKTLIETVNCYGTKMTNSKISVFYHGTSLLYFDKFIASFNSPTSTTTKLSVATIFARNNGIILALKKTKATYGLRYFNCSFISDFANEEERLFIHPPYSHYALKFASIRNVSTDENYDGFIKAMIKLEELFKGTSHISVSQKSISMISALIAGNNVPHYILKSFNKWADKKTEIKIDMQGNSEILELFDIENTYKNFNKIITIFKHIGKIEFEGGTTSMTRQTYEFE